MGWLYSQEWHNKKTLVNHLLNENGYTNGTKVVKHSLRGNNLWVVIQTSDGTPHIILFKLSSGGCDGWGYKDITEGMGPYEDDCPKTFIQWAQSQPNDNPNQYAKEWRERVLNKSNPKKQNQFSVGDTIEFSGKQYRLHEKPPRRKFWIVIDLLSGMRYRMASKYVNASKIVVQS